MPIPALFTLCEGAEASAVGDVERKCDRLAPLRFDGLDDALGVFQPERYVITASMPRSATCSAMLLPRPRLPP
jgi:hypothetical protein